MCTRRFTMMCFLLVFFPSSKHVESSTHFSTFIDLMSNSDYYIWRDILFSNFPIVFKLRKISVKHIVFIVYFTNWVVLHFGD